MKVLLEVQPTELFGSTETQKIVWERWQEIFRFTEHDASNGKKVSVLRLPNRLVKIQDSKGEIKWFIQDSTLEQIIDILEEEGF